MIEIVADKDIPYLKEVFENSKSFRLKTLPFDEINKKTLKNSHALLSRSATILNDELINGTDIKFIFSLTSGEDHTELFFRKKSWIDWRGTYRYQIKESFIFF